MKISESSIFPSINTKRKVVSNAQGSVMYCLIGGEVLIKENLEILQVASLLSVLSKRPDSIDLNLYGICLFLFSSIFDKRKGCAHRLFFSHDTDASVSGVCGFAMNRPAPNTSVLEI